MSDFLILCCLSFVAGVLVGYGIAAHQYADRFKFLSDIWRERANHK